MSAMSRRDFDEHHLDALERVKRPTKVQQGELAALRLIATDPTHQRRVERVDARWRARKVAAAETSRLEAELEAEYLR